LFWRTTNATHWSQRILADHLGIDKSMVERVWKQHKLQPHRVKTFKLSRDKQFVEPAGLRTSRTRRGRDTDRRA